MPNPTIEQLGLMKTRGTLPKQAGLVRLRVKLTRPLTWESGEADDMYIGLIPKGMTGTCLGLDRYAARNKSEMSVIVSWDMAVIHPVGQMFPFMQKWWEYEVDPGDVEFVEIALEPQKKGKA